MCWEWQRVFELTIVLTAQVHVFQFSDGNTHILHREMDVCLCVCVHRSTELLAWLFVIIKVCAATHVLWLPLFTPGQKEPAVR